MGARIPTACCHTVNSGVAGIRQTNRLRQRYLGSVLRQEIGFFDTTATTGILLQVGRPVFHSPSQLFGTADVREA